MDNNNDISRRKDFIENNKLISKDGELEILWHGSRSNTLTEFSKDYEGTGVVSQNRKYGGFFFSNNKEGAEYYCYDGIPEEKIDFSKGDVDVEVYGDDEKYYFIVMQSKDNDENEETLANGGPYKTREEAYRAGDFFIEEYNEFYEKKVNPYLYPVHLKMVKPYIYDTKKEGTKPTTEIIKQVKNMNKGFDGIKIIDIFDGDRVMDVYIVFESENIMILDRLDPQPITKKTIISSNDMEEVFPNTHIQTHAP